MTTTTMTTMSKRLAGALALSAALLVCGVAVVSSSPVTRAQSPTGQPAVRTVEGTVNGKDGKPIENAVVYIKDTKTLSIKSYLTDAKGYFHFGQLSLSSDYDVWAELNGAKSKTKSVSMFNSKPNLSYTLKLSE
ncbi:carboxypeptidase-like regulatory domain-containing protein [Granulicella cerasi]|uniref:Carboxypeptidase-like regulatory domain-containing protein n=1 Tax=Granulicella cerasi TaxID=741063 RepID=A0ABW1ZBJ0_9BACT|nr:carboxypeptidase-like regulatory domain-containing protein [Granulicella cerasi]